MEPQSRKFHKVIEVTPDAEANLTYEEIANADTVILRTGQDIQIPITQRSIGMIERGEE